jgi:hypothetical protein
MQGKGRAFQLTGGDITLDTFVIRNARHDAIKLYDSRNTNDFNGQHPFIIKNIIFEDNPMRKDGEDVSFFYYLFVFLKMFSDILRKFYNNRQHRLLQHLQI